MIIIIILVSFDKRIFDLRKDHNVSRKNPIPFRVIGNVKLVHKYFPETRAHGNIKNKIRQINKDESKTRGV